MDAARINCAHDDADAWTAMAANVRRAAHETGRPCRVCMDITGPRSRTASVVLPDEDYRVRIDDRILMSASPLDAEAELRFECSLADAVRQVEPGHGVWINEGELGTVVERKLDGAALLRVTHARDKGEHLRPDKGVNFPDTELRVSPLTDKDRAPGSSRSP